MIIPFLLPLMLTQFRPAAPAVPAPSTVLATLDGKPITAKDVAGYLWDWRAYEVAQELVNFTLISGEAKKAKVAVTDAELAQSLKEQVDQISKSLPPGTKFDQALIERGLTMSRLKMRLVMDKMLTKLVALGFDQNSYYRVSTLAIPMKSASTEDLSAAIKVADSAYDRISKGEDWGKVLADITKSDPAIRSGGDLGWFTLTEFPTAAQPAIKSAKKNGVIKPVQTPFGIQIFKVLGLGSEIKGPELETLRTQYSQTARSEYAKKLQSTHKVVHFWPLGIGKG